MPVIGVAASRSATRYIETITDFKRAVRAHAMDTPEFRLRQKVLRAFYAESRGRRRGLRSQKIDYLSRHGDIIDALNAWRQSKALPTGGRIVKNALIDLGIAVGGKLVEVFEAKTSAARSDIYGAIGQLMVHGAADECRRVLLLPAQEQLPDDLRNGIGWLGIEVLKFELDENRAQIL
jgi:hypothetical protein